MKILLGWRLLVPSQLRVQVINAAHTQPSSAHCGAAKCLERIRRNFYWPNMVVEVRDYIRKCEVCQTCKHPTRSLKPPMGAQIQSDRPFQRLYIDFIGPLPRTKQGNIGICILLDHFSKFTFLKPVKRFTSKVLINFLNEEIFPCYGVPETLISDNGTQFKSQDFSTLLSRHGVSHIYTGAYSPQANAAERVNRSINAALRAYVRTEQTNWDSYLSSINCSLRNSVHQSIGKSPYLVLFGQNMITHGKDYQILRNLNMLNEPAVKFDRVDEFAKIRSDISKYLEKAYKLNKKSYDLRTRPRSFNIGQEVIKRSFAQSNLAANFNAKLAPIGVKVRVKKKIGNSLYLLEDLKGKELGTFHAKDIWEWKT